MRYIILAFLFATSAIAAPGDRAVKNPNDGGTLSLCITDTTEECPLVVDADGVDIVGLSSTGDFTVGTTDTIELNVSGANPEAILTGASPKVNLVDTTTGDGTDDFYMQANGARLRVGNGSAGDIVITNTAGHGVYTIPTARLHVYEPTAATFGEATGFKISTQDLTTMKMYFHTDNSKFAFDLSSGSDKNVSFINSGAGAVNLGLNTTSIQAWGSGYNNLQLSSDPHHIATADNVMFMNNNAYWNGSSWAKTEARQAVGINWDNSGEFRISTDTDATAGTTSTYTIKFKVEADGDVVVPVGNLAVNESTPATNVHITDFDSDPTGNHPVLRLDYGSDSASWEIGDSLGEIQFYSSDGSSGQNRVKAYIKTLHEVADTSRPDAALSFGVSDRTESAYEAARINSDGKTELSVRSDGDDGIGNVASNDGDDDITGESCDSNCDTCNVADSMWTRVGNVVTWSFLVTLDPTATGRVDCLSPTPHKSGNFGSSGDGHGVCHGQDELDDGGTFRANATTTQMRITSANASHTNAKVYRCTGQYKYE